MKHTGSDIIIKLLEREGITTIPGIPGGANLPLYDSLYRSSIRHILARHEQGAGFIAQGMARVSGQPQVFFATSGPGATNTLTALADAKLDSIPIICITGQVPSHMIGTDAFQEIDTFTMSLPITKHNYLVRSPEELLRIIPEAFKIAASGRPGPILIDVPKNIQLAITEFKSWPEPAQMDKAPTPDENILRDITDMIEVSNRPVAILGGGIIHAGAADTARQFIDKASIPATTTLMGLGILPTNHSLFLGMLGMHGWESTNMILDECDLLINIGARFDDRAIGMAEKFCPQAKIIHIDIDASELGKIKQPHIGLQADAQSALAGLLPLIPDSANATWVRRCEELRQVFPETWECEAHAIIRQVAEAAGPDAIVTTDVGQHQMWAAQAYPFNRPRQWLTSGGLGTMGFGIPAAIGAALCEPGKPVVCITGDGSALMNIQELATLAETGANVKIILFDNQSLGLVRQQQRLFYGSRLHASEFGYCPDFVGIAKGFGISAHQFAAGDPIMADQFAEAIQTPGPVLITIALENEAMVFPMVAPGGSNTEMITQAPALRP